MSGSGLGRPPTARRRARQIKLIARRSRDRVPRPCRARSPSCHKRPVASSTRNQEEPSNEKTDLERAGHHRVVSQASAALAQDAAAGKTSFNKCLACHAIGEGAKNKVGPELNGLDGRKSGTAPGLQLLRAPTRIPASPGTRPNSRNTSRTRRRRCPAPRCSSPASRTRRKSTISGLTSRNSTRTEDQDEVGALRALRGRSCIRRWPWLVRRGYLFC